jgi:anti-anti-sigma factor
VTTEGGRRIGVDAGTELTAATASQLRSVVADAMQPGLVIDLHLESVESYDAAGLGLLVGLKRRVEAAEGHLVCVNPSAPLYSGIRKLGLHRVLDIRLDLQDGRVASEKGT